MSRKQYISCMRKRYLAASSKSQRSRLLDEIVETAGYNRKYAIRLLRPSAEAKRRKPRANSRDRYKDCMPAIALAWEALDYCCAERLHPNLPRIADDLARFGALYLDEQIREQLRSISRATLARRLSTMRKDHPRLLGRRTRTAPGSSLNIPVERYCSYESRPGALEVDLLEHNGGSCSGFYAFTLCVTDVVSGWTQRRAILGKSQRAVFAALSSIIRNWPHTPWALHSDNGSEFINEFVATFARQNNLAFSRSRPYKKNDNAHVEQRNGFLRRLIGYDRYETQQQVDWLNRVYSLLDPYSNLILPSMKLVHKHRHGSHVHRTHDAAKTPLARLAESGALSQPVAERLQAMAHQINPLAYRRQLYALIDAQPSHKITARAADNDS